MPTLTMIKRMTGAELRLWCYLRARYGGVARDRDGWFYASLPEIARGLGVDRSTVIRTASRLEAAGWLEVAHRGDNRRIGGPNYYRCVDNPPSDPGGKNATGSGADAAKDSGKNATPYIENSTRLNTDTAESHSASLRAHGAPFLESDEADRKENPADNDADDGSPQIEDMLPKWAAEIDSARTGG